MNSTMYKFVLALLPVRAESDPIVEVVINKTISLMIQCRTRLLHDIRSHFESKYNEIKEVPSFHMCKDYGLASSP